MNTEPRTATAALIERLEKATGPDRELDGAIFWTAKRASALRWFFNGSMGNPQHPAPIELPERGLGRHAVVHASPRYTESIDHALMLVPQGWTVANIGQRDNGAWWAELRRGFQTSYDKVELSGIGINDKLPPAVAVCIVALKARGHSAVGDPAHDATPQTVA